MILYIEISLISKHINESLVDFKESEVKIEDFKNTAFKDVKSKKDFYKKMFYEKNVKLHKKQDLSKDNQVCIG